MVRVSPSPLNLHRAGHREALGEEGGGRLRVHQAPRRDSRRVGRGASDSTSGNAGDRSDRQGSNAGFGRFQ